MRCQHCASIFGSIEQLQDHQAASCPGILSDSDTSFIASISSERGKRFCKPLLFEVIFSI